MGTIYKINSIGIKVKQKKNYTSISFLKMIILLLLSSSCCLSSLAQPGNFFTYLPGERIHSFECLKDGYIAATSGDNFAVAYLDSTGQINWTYINNQFDGLDSSNYLGVIKQTLDGGFVGVGSIDIGIDYKMIIVKLDSFGNLKWKKQHNTNSVGVKGYLDLIIENDSSFTVLGVDTSGGFTVNVSKLGDTSIVKKIPRNLNFFLGYKFLKNNNNYFVFGRGTFGNYSFERIALLDSSRNLISISTNSDTATLSYKIGKCYNGGTQLLWYNGYSKSNGSTYSQIDAFDYGGNPSSQQTTSLYEANFESDSTLLGVEYIPQSSDSNFIYQYNFRSNSQTKIGVIIPSLVLDYNFFDFQRDLKNNILVSGLMDPGGFNSPFLARVIDIASVGITSASKGEIVSDFRIFPNPTCTDFYIQPVGYLGHTNSYSIAMYDMIGKEVLSFLMSSVEQTLIDTRLFSKGIYILKISGRNNQIITTKKVIIY
jgi:hypothetical protein